MQDLQPYLAWTWEFFRTGFHDVNMILGLLVAMGAAYFLPRYSRIFAAAFGAVLFYLVAQVMIPVVAGNAAFRLPPLVDAAYWHQVVSLYAGFLIVITVFYIVKKSMLGSGH